MQNRLHYLGGTLNRATTERRNKDWVAEQLDHVETRVLPVWRDKNLIIGEKAEAVMATGDEARDVLERAGQVVLLGVNDGIAYVAADLSHHEEDALVDLSGPSTFVDLRQVGPAGHFAELRDHPVEAGERGRVDALLRALGRHSPRTFGKC